MTARLPLWTGVVLGLALLAAHMVYTADLDADDASISFRDARNLARGQGSIFTLGEPPVEGYSHFLWTPVLAAAARLELDLIAVGKVLGAGLAASTLVGIAILLDRSGAGKPFTWLAGGWLAASGSFATWAVSGMETGLVAATVIDMAGLKDAHIAHLPPQLPRLPTTRYGFGKWDVDHVLAKKPKFIQAHLTRAQWEAGDLTSGWIGTGELINDPRFLEAYTYVDDPAVGGLFERVAP